MQRYIVSAKFDDVRSRLDRVPGNRSARWDGFTTTTGRFDVVEPFHQHRTSGRFDTFSRKFRSESPSRFDSVPCFFGGASVRCDSIRYWSTDSTTCRYRVVKFQRDDVSGRCDRIRFVEGTDRRSGRFDISATFRQGLPDRFDSKTLFSKIVCQNEIAINATKLVRLLNRLESLSAFPTGCCSNRFDLLATKIVRSNGGFDAVFSLDDLSTKKKGKSRCRWTIQKPTTGKRFGRFDVALRLSHDQRPGLFDANAPCRDSVRFDWRAFVRPGWRLFAKNVATGSVTEIGFIDAEERVLSGVELSDGEYELIVRTSSLFWKDAHDRVVRRFSVRSETSETVIPAIENLRSTVAGTTTTIRWSAVFFPDVVFGLWFSPTSPVDTSRPPDAVSVALDGVTDYSFKREQTGAEYVAVAAIREERTGKASELFLDWTAPPRRPDDQVIVKKT